MKHRLCLLLALLSSALLSALEITSDWVIVCRSSALPVEQQSAKEIACYLEKVTGLRLQQVSAAVTGKKSITVEAGKYGPEEWDVRAHAGGVAVSGGLPNGILYAAYEFIEQGLGCRFLAVGAEYIPKCGRIILADDLHLKGRPHFTGRTIYAGNDWGPTATLSRKLARFSIKARQNGYYLSNRYGVRDRLIYGGGCHTYYSFSKHFPKDKEEYFSLDRQGRRLHAANGGGPGQICLSHPEVRDIVTRTMAEKIKKGRAESDRNFPGLPYPMLIDLSANDNPNCCVCPGCLALQKKYGGRYSGVMLDFTNDIAERIQKIYPGTMIQTFAYQFTEEPPLHIKPHPQILIQIAQLGREWSEGKGRDSLRSLDHPNNRIALSLIKGWAETGAHLKIWDYWIVYNQLLFPRTNISAIAPNIRHYRRYGAEKIFSENEIFFNRGEWSAGNFYELGYYLGARLMMNPDLPEKEIIAEFLNLYYGPAAAPMAELLHFLEAGMAKEPANMGVIGIGASYLTREFFQKSNQLLDQAEKLASGNKDYLERIGQERISFDTAALSLHQKLGLALDENQTIDRLHRNTAAAYRRYMGANLEKNLKKLEERCRNMKTRLPLPPRFQGKTVFDFPWYAMTSPNVAEWKQDPEAAGGKALEFTGKLIPKLSYNPKTFHDGNLELGIYDAAEKKVLLKRTFTGKDIPQDEKYHWYHLGQTVLGQRNTLWLHRTWWFTQNCVDQVYNRLSPNTEYDIHISMKLTGPAYVKGSAKDNAQYLDRIILVRKGR